VAGGSGEGVVGSVLWKAGFPTSLVVACELLVVEAEELDELWARVERSHVGVVVGCSPCCVSGRCELSAISSETLGEIVDCVGAVSGCIKADDETKDVWLG
jgi:hypothetical protein